MREDVKYKMTPFVKWLYKKHPRILEEFIMNMIEEGKL